MTCETRNKVIEKNRRALLRMVIAWLFVAKLFALKPNCTLPKRVGLWVADLISTAEEANYYLRLLTGHGSQSETVPIFDDAPLTIQSVTTRLKVLKKSLVEMRGWQEKQNGECFSNNAHTSIWLWRNCRGLAGLHSISFAFTTATQCRAPPFGFEI